MVYIIFSDVHGNLEAFDAVIKSFPDTAEKEFLCAGDVVGYGANPDECIDKVISLGAVNIMGNHDAAVLGKTDVSSFNPHAAAAVSWTITQLTEGSNGYLESLPYIHQTELFTMVHGTLHDPEEFRYMLTNVDARNTFDILKTQICFVGHSHVPAVFMVKDGQIALSFKKKIKLEDDIQYIINVGSVGQPRDGDWRACYCVYDPGKKMIELRRVEYDLKTAQNKIYDAGLPKILGDRLAYGR
ncbi:MAG: metallophosphoesterase family protein [Candidatus Omnitrophota bacterium]